MKNTTNFFNTDNVRLTPTQKLRIFTFIKNELGFRNLVNIDAFYVAFFDNSSDEPNKQCITALSHTEAININNVEYMIRDLSSTEKILEKKNE